MDERQRIGKRIAEVRKAKGLSQAKLAGLTGLAPGHIARVELGQHSTGIDLLTRICEPLGLRIELIEKEQQLF